MHGRCCGYLLLLSRTLSTLGGALTISFYLFVFLAKDVKLLYECVLIFEEAGEMS